MRYTCLGQVRCPWYSGRLRPVSFVCKVLQIKGTCPMHLFISTHHPPFVSTKPRVSCSSSIIILEIFIHNRKKKALFSMLYYSSSEMLFLQVVLWFIWYSPCWFLKVLESWVPCPNGLSSMSNPFNRQLTTVNEPFDELDTQEWKWFLIFAMVSINILL